MEYTILCLCLGLKDFQRYKIMLNNNYLAISKHFYLDDCERHISISLRSKEVGSPITL